MRELRVRLETVTPLLLHGADGRTPELRPPSFRGAMRYWWRAALGGIIGDENLETLHKLEGAVFGNPECGSLISLRLGMLNVQETNVYLLPHKNKVSKKGLVGTFELILSQLRHDDALVWDAACASLELALTFGGIGQRSRRGYGTLRVVEASDVRVKKFPTTKRGWEAHIRRVAKQSIEAAAQLAVEKSPDVKWARVHNRATYPCATNAGLIWLYDLQKVHSPIDAVSTFMLQARNKRALGGINPRQASPLWVRPIQMNSSYGLLCTVLTSDFRGANYEYVEDFLKNLEGEPLPLEVRGWNTL